MSFLGILVYLVGENSCCEVKICSCELDMSCLSFGNLVVETVLVESFIQIAIFVT